MIASPLFSNDKTVRCIAVVFSNLGFDVIDLSPLGNGVPDLAIFFAGRGYLIESKQGRVATKLSPAQSNFFAAWKQCMKLIVRDAQHAEEVGKRLLAGEGDAYTIF